MEKSVTFSNCWIPYSHRWAPYPTLLGSRWKHLLHFPTEGKNVLHFPTAKNLTATGGHHIQPYQGVDGKKNLHFPTFVFLTNLTGE